MTMSITHLSFSKSGGAGQVAQSLVDYQIRAGLEATFVYKTETNLKRDSLSNLPTVFSAAFDNFVLKNPKHSGLLSLTRDSLKSMDLATKSSGDVLHLHWINGIGHDTILNLASRHRAVFWTLHDMNPFTGACHQSLGCLGYKNACAEKCPAVRSTLSPLVKKNFDRKIQFLKQIKNLTLIAPSPWIRDAICSTPGLEGVAVETIGNPIGIDTERLSQAYFSNFDTPDSKTSNSRTIGFIATDVGDPNKSLESLLRAFKEILNFDSKVVLKCVGSGYEQFASRQTENVEFLGRLGKSDIGKFFGSIDLLVVPSMAETSPLVVLEASSFGKPVLMRDIFSANDLKLALKNVSTFEDDVDLPLKIKTLLYGAEQIDARETRNTVLNSFGINEIGSMITNLYIRRLDSV
jgi:glycosyltransferase involved in cell wall biosynthesis